jgi:anthranilate phosphoribosyltransferase
VIASSPTKVRGGRQARTSVDIVGTGGDGSHTFNISTCSMFGRGRGGRAGQQARQSRRGPASRAAADVLEAMGVTLRCPPAAIAQCIADTASASCSRPTTIRR